jgi:AcrR family transcriptional regulator
MRPPNRKLNSMSGLFSQGQLTNLGAGRPRSSAADLAILRAALKLFVERGFDGVTLEQVAKSARVARTTVYRRWSSKEALIAKAIVLERGEPEQALATGTELPRDLAARLLEEVSNVLTASNYVNVVARLIGSVSDHPELMSVYWDTYLVPRRKAIARVIEHLREEGLIRKSANTDILLDLISGAIMHNVLVRPGKHSPEELRLYLLDVIRELGISDALNVPYEKHPASRTGKSGRRRAQ